MLINYPVSRTDLAAECIEQFTEAPPEGVEIIKTEVGACATTTVHIKTASAAERIGKPVGVYTTVDLPDLDTPVVAECGANEVIAELFSKMLPREGLVLVVGLGNMNITPDALGPKVVEKLLATRHITPQIAEGLKLRPVAAIAPGVLGQTGMESSEIIGALVEKTNPVAVIAVDAYAASAYTRLGSTIQFADSGVVPGSGVLNARKELSEKTLGVRVLTIGVPTVVDAAENYPNARSKRAGSMMVTPRSIDLIIERSATLIADVLNHCLQVDLSRDDLDYLLA